MPQSLHIILTGVYRSKDVSMAAFSESISFLNTLLRDQKKCRSVDVNSTCICQRVPYKYIYSMHKFTVTVMYIVIPVAITAIYPSKQDVSDLGYTRAHVSFHL